MRSHGPVATKKIFCVLHNMYSFTCCYSETTYWHIRTPSYSATDSTGIFSFNADRNREAVLLLSPSGASFSYYCSHFFCPLHIIIDNGPLDMAALLHVSIITRYLLRLSVVFRWHHCRQHYLKSKQGMRVNQATLKFVSSLHHGVALREPPTDFLSRWVSSWSDLHHGLESMVPS